MTAPIIPADQWPAWADRLCFDDNGAAYFYGVRAVDVGMWTTEIKPANITMPSGWDWRVPVMRPSADQWPDEFKGNNAKLISCINALLSMDAAGSLIPHGIGGHARVLLAAAAHRLAPAPAIDLEQFRQSVAAEFSLSQALRAQGAISGTEMDEAEAKRNRLLALIDSNKNRHLPHVDDINVADLQPTKGEGEL